MRAFFHSQMCNIQKRQDHSYSHFFSDTWQNNVHYPYHLTQTKPDHWTQNANVLLSYGCFLNYTGSQINIKFISLKEKASYVNITYVKSYFEKLLSPRDMIWTRLEWSVQVDTRKRLLNHYQSKMTRNNLLSTYWYKDYVFTCMCTLCRVWEKLI